MSSMSFIEQSQVQRSQQVNSPTNAILQAGSDCGCNHSNLSMIAQSQKVGCGCNDGTSNTFDRTDEDSNPPVPVFADADGCYMVFDHMEKVIVPDTPLQDNPDYYRPVYRRECPKDGGGMDTERGGRGFDISGGGGYSGYRDPIDPSDDSDEDPDDKDKICLTCELINTLYDKLFEELLSGIPAILVGKEEAAYDALFHIMSDAMKEIFYRIFNGDGHDFFGIGHKEGIHDAPGDEHFGEIYQKMRIDLNLTGNITPFDNFDMQQYFLMMLHSLKDCPDQMVFRLGRKFDNTYFSFDNVTLPKGLLQEPILTHPQLFVNETEYSSERTHYGSTISLGKNLNDPCRDGYSVYKWTITEGGNGPSLWWRQKNPDIK